MKALVLLCGWWAGVVFAGEPVALFNGKDFEGWAFDLPAGAKPEQTWSVVDGVLVCKGRPPGVMRTLGVYGDYELTLEWRWAPGGRGGNGGCLIHCSTPRLMGPWPRSLEVQLQAGNAGDFWMIGERINGQGPTPKGRRWGNLTDASEKPVGEWNTMRIRAAGDTVTVWVNDELVNEGSKCSATKGAICLQSEGTEVHFRKVELAPVEPMPVAPTPVE